VFAPPPKATVVTATAANPGLCTSILNPDRKSWIKVFITTSNRFRVQSSGFAVQNQTLNYEP
jgi:hypothetical protein